MRAGSGMKQSLQLALIGGEEFSDGFEAVHAALLQQARQRRQIPHQQPVKVVFLPTCAAQDGQERVEYWCEQARQRLGALEAAVEALAVVDRQSAEDPENAEKIAAADLVYLGGGMPHTGMQILGGTACLQALLLAGEGGALIAGASAGAMMLCAHSWMISPELDQAVEQIVMRGLDPEQVEPPAVSFLDGLGLVPDSLCWPHLNMFYSQRWLRGGLLPPRTTMLGVDEQTALLLNGSGQGRVLGRGRVLVVQPDFQMAEYYQGDLVDL